MKIKQRTEVTMVTHETTVIRIQKAPMYCEGCESITPHFSLIEAISALSLPEEEIRRLAEIGEIHNSAGTDGSLQLCGRSAASISHGYLGGHT